MGKRSGIEWTEATWNPWHGCTKISPGCAHCYMYRDKRRYGQDPEKIVRSSGTFNDPLKWKDGKLIFTCSWSDFFIQEADAWRWEAWDVIFNTPQHIYQILTKRIGRLDDLDISVMPRNVWLGVSVENSRYLQRIEALQNISAERRFISYEPLLGRISPFSPEGIHWAIVGAESGPGARPMDLDWAREIRDKCAKHGIAFFMKQICEKGKPIPYEEFPTDLQIREFPRRSVDPHCGVRLP